MPLSMIKDLPRYECLLAAARDYPDLDPSATEAFLHLLRTGEEVMKVAELHLAQHDMSQGRFAVIMVLWRACRNESASTCLSPTELADRAGVTRATMTGLIDSLVRDGLVTRTPHEGDRRMQSVSLTDAGHALLSKILPSHFRHMAWLLQPLAEDERRTLVSLLTKIQARASEGFVDSSNHAGQAAR